MSAPKIDGEDLQTWVEQTTDGWRKLIATHPEALSLRCDIRGSRSVGELLHHIVVVELLFAERLSGLPETPHESIPFNTADPIFAAHDRAMSLLRELKPSHQEFWDEQIEHKMRKGGTMRVSRRDIFIHLLMHAIRHYAQLATLVRQNGISPDWQMDFLLLRARIIP